MNDKLTLSSIMVQSVTKMVADGRHHGLRPDIIAAYEVQTGTKVPPSRETTQARSEIAPVPNKGARRSVKSRNSLPPPRIVQDAQRVGFLKLMRSSWTLSLLAEPIVLHLLTVIGYRARWRGEGGFDGLSLGQALIGDSQTYGLSRKQERVAREKLARWGLVTFQTSPRGTVATLSDSRVFEIGPERISAQFGVQEDHQQGHQFSEEESRSGANIGENHGADEWPTWGLLGATNEEGKNGKREESKTVGKAAASPRVTDDQWLEGLCADQAYQGIYVKHEFAKCTRWCAENGKLPTRRRVTNWLNRCDRPVSAKGQANGLPPHLDRF